MYLSTLEITGYKLFNEKFSIRLEPGLTVLVGENGTGKSAIIDAIRLLLLEDEFGRSGISSSEFHRPINKPAKAKGSEKILVKGIFDKLEPQEQVAYLLG